MSVSQQSSNDKCANTSPLGSVIYPIMFHRLIDPLGFGWTTRVIAFVALAGLIFPLLVMKRRLPPPKEIRSMLDADAFREPSFMAFSIGLFFSFIGFIFPFLLPAHILHHLPSLWHQHSILRPRHSKRRVCLRAYIIWSSRGQIRSPEYYHSSDLHLFNPSICLDWDSKQSRRYCFCLPVRIRFRGNFLFATFHCCTVKP